MSWDFKANEFTEGVHYWSSKLAIVDVPSCYLDKKDVVLLNIFKGTQSEDDFETGES